MWGLIVGDGVGHVDDLLIDLLNVRNAVLVRELQYMP